MSKTFLTSDTHFFHENVIKFCDRPFESAEHMNERLISNWNSVVSPEDHVWHLGDVSFGNVVQTEHILGQLNGFKHLVTGNHDRKGRCQKLDWSKHFVSQHDYFRLKVVVGSMTYKSVLCHFPFASWERGYYNFHGHWHTTTKDPKGKWMQHDVGVDLNNYTPILLQDAAKRAIEGKEKVTLY